MPLPENPNLDETLDRPSTPRIFESACTMDSLLWGEFLREYTADRPQVNRNGQIGHEEHGGPGGFFQIPLLSSMVIE